MTVLLNISGMGTLTTADGETLAAHVTLIVEQQGGMKYGRGTIKADFSELHRLFTAQDGVTLQIKGHEAKIIVTKNNSFGLGEFVTSGPVSGV